jgi:hypothetical protein
MRWRSVKTGAAWEVVTVEAARMRLKRLRDMRSGDWGVGEGFIRLATMAESGIEVDIKVGDPRSGFG